MGRVWLGEWSVVGWVGCGWVIGVWLGEWSVVGWVGCGWVGDT